MCDSARTRERERHCECQCAHEREVDAYFESYVVVVSRRGSLLDLLEVCWGSHDVLLLS